jgi:hypothetical protein
MAFWRRKPSAPKQHAARAVLLGEEAPVAGELVQVVGESFHQTAISSVSGREGVEAVAFDCIAALVAEPDNLHDPNAIGVQIEAQIVGHLSREDAILYHPLVDAAARLGVVIACNARIAAREPDEATTTNAGVFLHLPSPEDAAKELAEWSRETLR